MKDPGQMDLFGEEDEPTDMGGNIPWCDDCASPLMASYSKPVIKRGKPPAYPWYCPRHGTQYRPQRPPRRR